MLPVIDIVHRSVVLSLVGLSAYGLYVGYAGHNARMARAKGEFRVQVDANSSDSARQ